MAELFSRRWSGVGTGGAVSLDFVNTLDWRLRPEPTELLHSYSDLLRWGWSSGALAESETGALLQWSRDHPQSAARILGEAVSFREALAEIFQAQAHGRGIPEAPLKTLAAHCRAAWERRELRVHEGGVIWAWGDVPPSGRRPLWGVALDAARLLTSESRTKIRQCADDYCGWLFLDLSRNHSRRWCSMQDCGNRNKARAFHRRAVARNRGE